MKSVFLALTLVFLITIPVQYGHTAKSSLTNKSELDTFGHAESDQPFNTTAIIEGKCSDVDLPKSDSRQMIGLYKSEKDFSDQAYLHKVGLLYYNNRGQESICIEDGAVNPLFLKNVDQEMVFTVGRRTSGKYYGIDQDKIIVVDSMECIEDSSR